MEADMKTGTVSRARFKYGICFYISVAILDSVQYLNGLLSFFDGRLVHRDEVVVTFRNRFHESFCHIFHLYDRFHLEKRAQNDHVVNLGASEFGSNVNGSYRAYGDVFACRKVGYAVRVVNEQPAWFYTAFEFVQ